MGDLTAHFDRKDFACKCGCGGMPTDDYIDFIEAVRVRFGLRMLPSSGFRCAAYNKKIGGAAGSSHPKGIASDTPTPNSEYRFLLIRATMDEARAREVKTQIEVGVKDGKKWLHIGLDQSQPNKLFTSEEA